MVTETDDWAVRYLLENLFYFKGKDKSTTKLGGAVKGEASKLDTLYLDIRTVDYSICGVLKFEISRGGTEE